MTVESAIEEMVRRIVEQFQPDKVILFGSHARGDARPDSDVDLLVVMDMQSGMRDHVLEIQRAIRDVRIPKDVLITTPDDLERDRTVPGTIARAASREGRVLYDRAD